MSPDIETPQDRWWYPALWPIAVLVGLLLHVLIMVVMNGVAFVHRVKRRRDDLA